MQPTVPGVKQLYSLLFYALAPFLLFRLFWKSRRVPAYRERISERFGVYSGPPKAKSPIWIHAVSVGECEAAFPIIMALLQRGDFPLLISCTTPTGSARIREVLGIGLSMFICPTICPMRWDDLLAISSRDLG